MTESVLEVKNLKTHLFTRYGTVKAVDGVSFSLKRGETLGLVGESGCGKSMTCRSILRLAPYPAGKIVGGEILLEGKDLLQLSDEEMRKVRGDKIAMILQDPMTSLNPVFRIEKQISEGIRIHTPLKKRDIWDRACELMKSVRIPAPEMRLKDFPHQLSGGMRQRVVGAIALSSDPALLIADEPTTSLDTTIQAQFLNLLLGLQKDLGLSMIMVTHDFGVVARVCTEVAVMYAGKIVEKAAVREIFDHPSHPYTKALMDAVPKLEDKVERLASIEGQPPALHSLPKGCAFRDRCQHAISQCHNEEVPPLEEIKPGHLVRCWRSVPNHG